MPSRRALIAMSDDEIWEFVETQRSIQVCTLNRDGSPHLTTMWFGIRDENIILESFTKSQKIVNLKRNPKMAVLLEDGVNYNELRGVSINCNAELIEDYDTVCDLHKVVFLRNQDRVSTEQTQNITPAMYKKKTMIVVNFEKIMSWDHRKLGDNY